jgi:2-polyprenyl-6-hydroxyphenyl methylase/3-demethylubiquinone-9 3-methyltransferase
VAPGGLLWLAVYNDQGATSRVWKRVKKLYVSLPAWLRVPYVLLIGGIWAFGRASIRILSTLGATLLRVLTFNAHLQPASAMYGDLFRSQRSRGMHWWYDLVDWIGGWPFEVAKPEEVFTFLRERGFELVQLKTCAGNIGCNEFVFRRVD